MPSVNQIGSFCNTHTESGHVEITCGIQIRHDGRFATEQCCAGLTAAVTDSADKLFQQIRIVFAHGNVVKKKQRLCAKAQAVIHTHRHQINADRVVSLSMDRHLNFCAYTIGAGHKDRVFPLLFCVQAKQSGEATRQLHNARCKSLLHELRQLLHALLVQFEIDAGGTIGQF